MDSRHSPLFFWRYGSESESRRRRWFHSKNTVDSSTERGSSHDHGRNARHGNSPNLRTFYSIWKSSRPHSNRCRSHSNGFNRTWMDSVRTRTDFIHTWSGSVHTRPNSVRTRMSLIHTRTRSGHVRTGFVRTWRGAVHTRTGLLRTRSVPIRARSDSVHVRICPIRTRMDLIHARMASVHTRGDAVRIRTDSVHLFPDSVRASADSPSAHLLKLRYPLPRSRQLQLRSNDLPRLVQPNPQLRQRLRSQAGESHVHVCAQGRF